jgi:hypothetical protein
MMDWSSAAYEQFLSAAVIESNISQLLSEPDSFCRHYYPFVDEAALLGVCGVLATLHKLSVTRNQTEVMIV